MIPRTFRLTSLHIVWHGLATIGLILAALGMAIPVQAATPPPNDNRADALFINANPFSHTILDITGATTEAGDPVITCGGGSQHLNSVWYVFVPSQSGEVLIDTTGSTYDTVLAVFQDDPLNPGSLLQLGCNDNSGSILSSVKLLLRSGVRYYVEVVRKTGTTASQYRLNLRFQFTARPVAWGTGAGKKWDASEKPYFSFQTDWQAYPLAGAYKDAIHISHSENNWALMYFDGGQIDLVYALGPTMGSLDIYIDDVLMGTLNQGNANFVPNQVWTSPPLSDGVHKLKLHHLPGGKANFDYVTVYAYPDTISPAKITTLNASVNSNGQVVLSWKAVGDDKNVGTARSYELRYFKDSGAPPDCVADWASGNTYPYALPAPALAGTTQQATLNGFWPGVKYHFCLVAKDEVGNPGIPSNRAEATPTAPVTIGPGGYDDRHPAWNYNGNWEAIRDDLARQKTLRISRKVGNSAVFNFTGTQFVFTYVTGATHGKMDVFVDGTLVATIDQNTPFPRRFTYTSPIFTLGPHTVRFVHKTQGRVTVDEILITNLVDGGPPDPIADLVATPGTNDGEVFLTWTAPGDDGSSGTAKKYEVRYSLYPITNLFDWSNAKPAAGVIPLPQPAGTAQSMTVVGLTPGAHYYFAIRTLDDAWYWSLSNTVDSDVQYTGAYAGCGPYEDGHSIWSYIGNVISASHPNATGGSYRLLLSPPASLARFWFNGTQFRLVFTKDPSYGGLKVFVDGKYIGKIVQSDATTLWKQTWTSPTLSPGNHVVEFQTIGKATVDRIVICP